MLYSCLKRVALLCIFTLIISIISWFAISADNTAKWVRVVYPPGVEKDPTQEKYSGYTITLEEDLQKQLPQYSHTVEYSNWQRLIEIVKSEQAVSTMLLKTPEREAVMHYSEPLYLFPTRMIVCRSKDQKKFSKNHSISLEKLLQNKKLSLGVLPGRAYGEVNDKIIAKFEGAVNIVKNPAAEGMDGLFQMLQSGRIDYFIEYPKNIIYYQKTHPELKDGLATLKISEDITPYDFTYFVAPKNDWGKKIVDEVNAIMKNYARKDSFFQRHKIWAPEHLWKEYKNAWEKRYGKLIKGQ